MSTTQTSGAALKPLSKQQIRELVLLARQAYGIEFPPSEESFDAWRHRHCLMAVERGGLTKCLNEDYLPLKAHWLTLLGRTEQADRCRTKHEMEPRTWAIHKLRDECSAASDVLPGAWQYACGFVRNKRHVEIEEADETTVWHAIFVVRRRAEQIRRKGRAAQ